MKQSCKAGRLLGGLLALSATLQGCSVAPATGGWAMQPVQRIQNSAGHTAASWFELGKFYQQREQWQMAAEAYQASLAHDRHQLAARNAMAALDARAGRLEQAEQALKVLVAEFPDAAQPRNNLGYVYYLQGQLALASSTLQQAVALDDGRALARNNLLLVQAAQAELAMAKAKVSGGTDAPAAPAPPMLEIVTQVQLDIVNGDGAAGMAARMRQRVQAHGVPVRRLLNLAGYGQARSTLLYLRSCEQQALALQKLLPQQGAMVQMVAVESLARGAGIRLVLGSDLQKII